MRDEALSILTTPVNLRLHGTHPELEDNLLEVGLPE